MKRLLLIAALFLAGCGATPQQKVFNAHLTYDAALSGAVFYRELPKCPALPLCHEPAVLATIQQADKVAFEALSSAQKAVRNPTATKTALETAATWASEAIAAFSRVVAVVKEK
jgi:hypothetical protein